MKIAISGLMATLVLVTGLTSPRPTHGHATQELTRIHVVTPFAPNGAVRSDLHLQPVFARCEPDSSLRTSISRMATFTCFLPSNASAEHPFGPGKAAYVCRSLCRTDPCWKIAKLKPLTMVCLSEPDFSTPFEGFQGTRVRVTNDPPLARGIDNPMNSQPWRFDLRNDESCVAVYPDNEGRTKHPPLLDYACGLGSPSLYPYGQISRRKPLWTIPAANTRSQAAHGFYLSAATITEVWFIGNGPG